MGHEPQNGDGPDQTAAEITAEQLALDDPDGYNALVEEGGGVFADGMILEMIASLGLEQGDILTQGAGDFGGMISGFLAMMGINLEDIQEAFDTNGQGILASPIDAALAEGQLAASVAGPDQPGTDPNFKPGGP